MRKVQSGRDKSRDLKQGTGESVWLRDVRFGTIFYRIQTGLG